MSNMILLSQNIFNKTYINNLRSIPSGSASLAQLRQTGIKKYLSNTLRNKTNKFSFDTNACPSLVVVD